LEYSELPGSQFNSMYLAQWDKGGLVVAMLLETILPTTYTELAASRRDAEHAHLVADTT